jgi:hypothetical protein
MARTGINFFRALVEEILKVNPSICVLAELTFLLKFSSMDCFSVVSHDCESEATG